MPFKFWKVIKKHGYTKKEVAILGDQLFTDMLGGHLAGIYTDLDSAYFKN